MDVTLMLPTVLVILMISLPHLRSVIQVHNDQSSYLNKQTNEKKKVEGFGFFFF